MASGLPILARAFDAFSWLAQNTPTTQQVDAPWYARYTQNPLFLIVIMVVVMYVFVIRSKQKTEKQRQSMLNQLKRGDRIQTIGGILGTVVEAKETEVLVKVDESSNAKVRFVRSAVHRVVETDDSKDKDKDKDKTETK